MNILQKWENKFLLVPKILQTIVCLQYYTLHNLRHLFASDFFKIQTGQYGQFNAYIQALTFFANISINSLADRLGKHKKVLIALIFGTCGIFSTFYVANMFKVHAAVFWIILLIYQTVNMPKQPLLDKIIFDYLQERPDCTPEVYGKQRMWGTVAYTAATFIVENLVKEQNGTQTKYHWNNLLYYAIFFTGLSALCLTFLINTKETVRNRQKTTGYVQLMKNKEYAFFIFIMFMNAVTRQAMSNYLANFHARVLAIKPYDLPNTWPAWWKSTVNIFNKNYISTISMFGTFFEIMSMYFSDRIISKLGYFMPLLIAQIISLVRFYAYYTMDKDSKHVFIFSCLIELIKGLYFGLAHISGFVIAARLAPPYLSATSQAIFQGVFNCMGAIVSGSAFSYAFGKSLKKGKSTDVASTEEIGSFKLLFFVNICISLFTIALYIIKYGIIDGVLTNKDKEMDKLTYVETEEEMINRLEAEEKETRVTTPVAA